MMLSRDRSDIDKDYIFLRIVSSYIPSIHLMVQWEPLQAMWYHLALSLCTIVSDDVVVVSATTSRESLEVLAADNVGR